MVSYCDNKKGEPRMWMNPHSRQKVSSPGGLAPTSVWWLPCLIVQEKTKGEQSKLKRLSAIGAHPWK
jgi:hypothetical protein